MADNYDVYGKIAGEFNVERGDVKSVGLGIAYGVTSMIGKKEESFEEQLRRVVRTSLELGFIEMKKEDKNEKT